MIAHAIDNLPHRAPFRFVSRVESLTPGDRAAAVWDLRGDEAFFSGHFPGQPVVPGVLIAEALAQVSGLVAFCDGPKPPSPARLAQVNVKFLAGVSPPASIRLEAVLTRHMTGLYLFDVRATAGGAACAAGTLVLAADQRGDQGARH